MSKKFLGMTLVGSLLILAPMTASATTASGNSPMARFDEPVLLTPIGGVGGYEPAVLVDKSDNIWVTAHKNYQSTVASPDTASPTGTRNSSWLWVSKDGKSFGNPPGATSLQEQNALPGVEADLAVDAAGNVYFADLNLATQTLSQWGVKGSKLAKQHTTVLPIAELADDRPWIAAGTAGTVLVSSHPGSTSSDLGENTGGNGFGPGDTAVTVSRDGGRTLRTLRPYTLKDSGFCRPWVDKTPGSKKMLMLCDQTQQKIQTYAFTSSDLGVTWTRQILALKANDPSNTPPFFSIGQAANGTLHALYARSKSTTNPDPLEAANLAPNLVSSQLTLMTSKDMGRTWSYQDITPGKGVWQQASLAVSKSGTVGVVSYFRAAAGKPWTVRAGTFTPGKKLQMTELNPGRFAAAAGLTVPQGDFIQGAFDSKNRFNVAWNSQELTEITAFTNNSLGKGGSAQVLFARQR